MSNKLLPGRNEIASIIPHSGAMVLVDQVLSCDTEKLVATVTLSPSSPLAFEGQLGGETLLEYAGQCTALHGALSSAPSNGDSDSIAARPAFISQTKALRWLPQLPDTTAEITVNLEGQTADGAIYRFRVIDLQHSQQQELASGTLSVIFSNIEPAGL